MNICTTNNVFEQKYIRVIEIMEPTFKHYTPYNCYKALT